MKLTSDVNRESGEVTFVLSFEDNSIIILKAKQIDEIVEYMGQKWANKISTFLANLFKEE